MLRKRRKKVDQRRDRSWRACLTEAPERRTNWNRLCVMEGLVPRKCQRPDSQGRSDKKGEKVLKGRYEHRREDASVCEVCRLRVLWSGSCRNPAGMSLVTVSAEATTVASF